MWCTQSLSFLKTDTPMFSNNDLYNEVRVNYEEKYLQECTCKNPHEIK